MGRKTTFHFILFILLAAGTGTGETRTPAVVPEKPSLALQGKELYSQLRCSYCHRLKGRGGTVGPNLDNVGFRRTKEWMADHFRDPQKISHGSKMARITLTDSQVQALTTYMKSLGGRTFTPKAPGLFLQNCASCHRMGGEGLPVLMDLSREGTYRDFDFIQDFISHHSQRTPQAGLKGFQGVLTRPQIKDLAAYVLRGGE